MAEKAMHEGEMILSSNVIRQAREDYAKAMKIFNKENPSSKELSRAVELYVSVTSPMRCDLGPFAAYVGMSHDDVIQAFKKQFGSTDLNEQRKRLQKSEKIDSLRLQIKEIEKEIQKTEEEMKNIGKEEAETKDNAWLSFKDPDEEDIEW